MAEGCSVALSGPSLVGASTGAASSHEELGGAQITVSGTGAVSALEPDEPAALRSVRRFLSYVPSNSALPVPISAPAEPGTPGERLHEIVPDRSRRGYDMRRVIDAVVDGGSYFEIHREFARSVVVGLARMQGQPVGIIANQPKHRGGVLDADAAVKVSRFAEMVRVRRELGDEAAAAVARELETEMHSAFEPWQAASQSFIHDVIRPEDTRQAVLDGLFIASGYR
jgi:propionyl-CoA carboxylase beta chain